MNLLLGGMQLLIFTTAASPHVASHRTIGPAAAFPANLEGWQDCLDNHFPQVACVLSTTMGRVMCYQHASQCGTNS